MRGKERTPRLPDPVVSKKHVTIGGHSTKITYVDLSMADPDALPPSDTVVRSIREEIDSIGKTPLRFPKGHSKRR